MRNTTIILALWVLIIQNTTAQVDSTNLTLSFDIENSTFEHVEIKPYCDQAVDSFSLMGNYINLSDHNIYWPIPDSQFVSISHHERYMLLTYGDNNNPNILEGSVITITVYRDSTVQYDQLFKEDFLKMRLGLIAKNLSIADLGQDTINTVKSYWVKTEMTDVIGTSKNVMYYLAHPFTSRCITILATTYAEKNAEEQLCKHINYFKNVDWVE